MKKKFACLAICSFCVFNLLFAQTTFRNEVLRTNISEVKPTGDGGYISSGWYSDLNLKEFATLIKTNNFGDTLWTRYFGESGDAIGMSVCQTTDGGYILAGGTNADSLGNDKVYLIKTNSLGDTLWTKKYGGAGQEGATCVHQTFDSGYIISGETSSFGAGGFDAYIIKTDSNGTVQWSRTFGSIYNDGNAFVIQTSDSGFASIGTFNFYSPDIMLIKMNSMGDTLWTKCYGGLGIDYGYEMKETFNHGFVIAAYTNSFGSGDGDMFVINTDSIGNIQWSKTYGETGADYSYSIFQTMDNGYVVCGNTNNFGATSTSWPYVIKINAVGDTMWSKIYNDSLFGVGFSIESTIDGGYIMGGEGISELTKLDSNGSSGCLEQSVLTKITSPATMYMNDTILVNIVSMISMPTSSTVGIGIGIIDACITSGISEMDAQIEELTIFPNPSTNYFTLQLASEFKNVKIEIFNSLGQRIYLEEMNSKGKTISCENFPAGMYFIKANAGQKQFFKKIIIE